MRRLIYLLPIGGLVFACPQPQTVLNALKEQNIPVKEVISIKPSKTLKGFCTAEGILEKDGFKKEVEFYITEDGKYLAPFVGTISYKPSPIKGLKEIWITSVRNSKTNFRLGYLTEDGKFYIPEIVAIKNKTTSKKEKKAKK